MIDLGILASLGPWYKFWKPESGMIGGLIFGSVITTITAAVVVLSHWALSL